MILELAAQTTDPSNVVWMVGTGLLGLLGGTLWQWRRNGRRGNPGNDADRYRGKGGSNCKPGLGEVCLGHGRGISANKAGVAALGAQQAAIHKSQDEMKVELREMRKETRDAFSALHRRFDDLLSKG